MDILYENEQDNKYIQQTLNNKEIKNKIITLEDRVNVLEISTVKIEDILTKIILRKLKHKIIISITDLDENDMLEHKLQIPFNDLLRRLHYIRSGIDYFDYININKDTEEFCNRKKKALLFRLKQLSDEEKAFMNKYTEIIGHIILYLESLNIVVEDDEEEDEDINEWWEE